MNIRVVKTIFHEQLMLPLCNVLFIIWSEVGTSAKSSWGDPAGKHTRFPCVTYFFISSLVKYGKYECFGLR